MLLYLYFNLNVKLDGKNEFEIQISGRCHVEITNLGIVHLLTNLNVKPVDFTYIF